MDYYSPLYPDKYYHIYNRGNNGENLFYKKENYFYFLKRYNYYLNDYLDTFAYCLLPNHFHLLVRVKPEVAFSEERLSKFQKPGKSAPTPSEAVSEQFRKLFMSNAKGINKQESRTGSLFQKNFKRKPVEGEHYFSKLIYYIHANPQQHGIIDDFKFYPYSSYDSLLSDKPTKLFRNEAIEWFGSKDSFRAFHTGSHSMGDMSALVIED